jgi:hypothetical protein
MKTINEIIESVHYVALITLFIVVLLICAAHHTQSHSAQRMHQIEFEQCIGDDISDTHCEECYGKIMDHHNYWFNNDLYNEE